MKTKVINLLGGPCTGKSTLAAALFVDMKLSGYSVELVTEYAKELVYDDRHKELSNQLYVTAKQYKRINRLLGKVEYIITDSPILLSKVYAELYGYNSTIIDSIYDEYSKTTNNQYFLLSRNGVPYQQYGRTQNELEALNVDSILNNILDRDSKAYKIVKDLNTDSRVKFIKTNLDKEV